MWFKKNKDGKNAYLLLDRSASMFTEWSSTLESINSYVSKLEDNVNVYIAAFDDISYDVIRETSVKDYKIISKDEIKPRGSTPLYDSAGKIMSKIFEDNPSKAVLVIMTDGQENSSREYKLNTIKARLKEMETKEWPVVYLGAGFNEVETYATGTFNISVSNTFNTTASTRGLAMSDLGMKSMNYFSGIGSSATAMHFTNKEKMKYQDNTK